jgi:hypothetical protein
VSIVVVILGIVVGVWIRDLAWGVVAFAGYTMLFRGWLRDHPPAQEDGKEPLDLARTYGASIEDCGRRREREIQRLIASA